MVSHESAQTESTPNGLTLENQEGRRGEIIGAVDIELDRRLHERFSTEEFHNPTHSYEVDERSKRTLDAIKEVDPLLVTEDDDVIRHTTARGHDVVINYISIANRYLDLPSSTGLIKNPAYGNRMRFRGFAPGEVPQQLWPRQFSEGQPTGIGPEPVGNERASANETIEIVSRIDPNGEVYNQHVKDGIVEAIGATYPAVEPKAVPSDIKVIASDREIGIDDLKPYLEEGNKAFRFYQKHLTPKSSLPALSVALGDLAYSGVVDETDVLQKGNAEYQETRDLTRYELAKGIDQIPDSRKVEIVADMSSWIRSQVQFFLWQKINFAEIIASNEIINSSPKADQIKQTLSDMYNKFDANVVAAMDRYDEVQHFLHAVTDPAEQLKALAANLGYTV
ncbi:MAG: hypothetical protein RL094_750 [Candidatus Parcubacteria bacterium]|jgi:hypothetical protein